MEKMIEEINAYFNSLVPADRYRQTVRSSLADLDTTEYQLLYQIVTDKPSFTKKEEILIQVLDHYQIRKSRNAPFPLLFRQAVYSLAYELCNGDYYDTAQKKVLKDIGLSLNCFTKWHMQPKNDYLLDIHYKNKEQLTMPIYYQGKKDYALVYLIGELSKQVHYKTFVDVFCGSGTVTLGIPKYPNRNYFMNDIDTNRTNLINIIQDNSEDFLNSLTDLIEKIKNFPQDNVPNTDTSSISLFPEMVDWKIISLYILKEILKAKKAEEAKTPPKKKPYIKVEDVKKYVIIPDIKSIADMSIADIENHIDIAGVKKFITEYNCNIQCAFAEGLCFFFNRIITDASTNPLQRAIATVYNDTFSSRRKPTVSNLNSFFATPSYWKNVIAEFQSFNVSTMNQYDYLAVREFCSKDTLLYLDSPYIGTAGYTSAYTKENFQLLCTELKNFKGYWIFSCRASIKYKSAGDPADKKEYTESDLRDWEIGTDRAIRRQRNFEKKAAAIRFLLDLYEPLAPNVAFIRPANSSDESFFCKESDKNAKEVLFFNFKATVPDIKKFFKNMQGRNAIGDLGCNANSVCQILSYEEFYALAQKGLSLFDNIY